MALRRGELRDQIWSAISSTGIWSRVKEIRVSPVDFEALTTERQLDPQDVRLAFEGKGYVFHGVPLVCQEDLGEEEYILEWKR